MSPYQPPTFDAPIDLDLSRNEGRPAITTLDLDEETMSRLISRYPDTRTLAGLVASRHDVSTDRVLVTAGGDDALFRCFLRTSGPIVASTPSFEMIGSYASQLGRQLVEVPWWEGDFPTDDFLSEQGEMAVIVSPNNPTGGVIEESYLRKVASGFPLVVLDAAYVEFADQDLTPAALEMDNVVVVRTMSKAFGLAGLRVGYLLGSPEMVSELAGYGSPYSLSALSAAVAAGVLAYGTTRASQQVADVRANRERLFGILEELGARPLPSQGNFVLATDVAPDWVVPAAASLGIAFRRFPDRDGLGRCVRITVPGDAVSMDRLESTLRAVLAPQALLFDMDGVLADVRGSYRAAILATAATYGVTVDDLQVVAAKAAGSSSDDWELTRRLLADGGVDVPYDEVKNRFETIYQGDDSAPGLKMTERLLADRDLLASLARQMPLGVVTARPRRDAEEFLERFDVRRFFSVVVAREDAPSKPDPAPVRLALERLGVAHAWMVGDTRDDLHAARDAGVVPVAVAVAGDDTGPLRAAARIVNSVDEIEEVRDATQG